MITSGLKMLFLIQIMSYFVFNTAERGPSEPFDNRTADRPQHHHSLGGATYTRWGRRECPPEEHTVEVYQGFAGGQWFQHVGGASNYLCLPSEPEWGNFDATVRNHGIIYGAEYEIGYNAFYGISTSGVSNLQNHNVPCAVCQSNGRTAMLMIPARKSCPHGWHEEYNGFLMSAHHGHKRTEYICMDGYPEADPAGYRDENGALFYFVEGTCGSLPCPPYVNGRELTCVVCTK